MRRREFIALLGSVIGSKPPDTHHQSSALCRPFIATAAWRQATFGGCWVLQSQPPFKT